MQSFNELKHILLVGDSVGMKDGLCVGKFVGITSHRHVAAQPNGPSHWRNLFHTFQDQNKFD